MKNSRMNGEVASEAPLVVLGDVLLDSDISGVSTRRCPDAPSAPVIDETERWQRPGGAGLAALIAAQSHPRVVLITPLADDDEAEELTRLLRPHVTLCPLPATGPTTTKSRVQVEGRTLARVDGGDCRADLTADLTSASALDALASASAIVVADYGRDTTRHPQLRRKLTELARRIPVVWDPHPRGAEPVPGCVLVTPNSAEAVHFLSTADSSNNADSDPQRAAALRALWKAGAVAVTAGAEGAYVCTAYGTDHAEVPHVVSRPAVFDTCGAGDCFSSTAAAHLAAGADCVAAVTAAVHAATRYIWGGGASKLSVNATARRIPPRPTAQDDPIEYARELRARGLTVVAAGGCFDLLHRGHLSLLREARALGDALVVCLNSDASVRRLKGPERPVLNEADRAQTLRELATVDAVVVFDEDDPRQVLEKLQPDVWVKGGDYEPIDLPEAEVIRRYGGEIVIVPTLDGYSTSSLLRRLQTPHVRNSS